ncbi:hypothetical protein M3Y99_00893100 [Aphelenchoides fujianensis]|nr:hypothetical protein M3Y99_00893100 [Aphelenchoides fujianensis]
MCLYNRLLGLNKNNTRCNTTETISDEEEAEDEAKLAETIRPPTKMRTNILLDDSPPLSSGTNNGAKNKLSKLRNDHLHKGRGNECPESGQVCTLSDRTLNEFERTLNDQKNASLIAYLRFAMVYGDRGIDGKWVAEAMAGIPVSFINAKPGECPQPSGVTGTPDNAQSGCWLDSGCPGVQKCCLEPNPANSQATRICRDPLGISRKLGTSVCNLPLAVGDCSAPTTRYYCKTFQFSGCNGNANNFQSLSSCQATCSYLGTPLCPQDANAGVSCSFAHADSCQTDEDCLGRQNNIQPSCCMTRCGFRICYLY